MNKLLCYLFGHKWERIGHYIFCISNYQVEIWKCKRCAKRKIKNKQYFP